MSNEGTKAIAREARELLDTLMNAEQRHQRMRYWYLKKRYDVNAPNDDYKVLQRKEGEDDATKYSWSELRDLSNEVSKMDKKEIESWTLSHSPWKTLNKNNDNRLDELKTQFILAEIIYKGEQYWSPRVWQRASNTCNLDLRATDRPQTQVNEASIPDRRNTHAIDATNSEDRENNTKRIDWKEVHRSCPVAIIGDLHGNMQAYTENMKSAGLIDDEGNWTGGNAKVNFVGDILGDRNYGGFQIAQKILKLGDKAIHLAGNHEDFLISTLIGTTAGNGAYNLNDPIAGPLAYTGCVFEIYNLLPEDVRDSFSRNDNVFSRAQIVTNNREKMIKKLKEDHPDVLEYILSLKLCYRIDDHMVTHTPPTQRMVECIFTECNGNIESINNKYQELLRSLLTDDQCVGEDRAKKIKELRMLQYIFLETGNALVSNDTKKNVTDNMWSEIRNNGINSWAYGHDANASKMAKINYLKNRDGILLIPVDTAVFREPGKGDERSFALCDTKGKITVGEGIGKSGGSWPRTYSKKDSETGRTIARE